MLDQIERQDDVEPFGEGQPLAIGRGDLHAKAALVTEALQPREASIIEISSRHFGAGRSSIEAGARSRSVLEPSMALERVCHGLGVFGERLDGAEDVGILYGSARWALGEVF
jgi:hypothetical protein